MREMDMTEQAYRNGYAAGLADGKPKWIPVNEHQPEDDQPTSVKDPIHAIATIKYKGGYTTREAIRMFTASRWVWWNYLGCEVVAWMPLPEPPEVK